jgi:hypothetical protein
MRLKMIMTYIMACALGLISVGCSTFSKDPNKTVEIPANKLDNIPQWYLAKDPEDKKHIVVVATDVSRDMQFAIDKATLNAKIQLASRLRTDVDSLTRETTLESGNAGSGNVEREIDRVSKVRVKQAMGFFKRENIAVFKEGDNYRAYVQYKIAVEDMQQFNKKENTKSREDRLKELDGEKVSNNSTDSNLVAAADAQLLDVNNEEYKRRRAEAVQKPNAVVGQYTIR